MLISLSLSLITAKLEDEDRLHLLSVDDDVEGQCIRFLSFCKKHKQPSNDRSAAGDRIGRTVRRCSDYTPPSNPSGCARTGMLMLNLYTLRVAFLLFLQRITSHLEMVK